MNVEKLLARKKKLEEAIKAEDAKIKKAQAEAKRKKAVQVFELIEQAGLANLELEDLAELLKKISKPKNHGE